MAKPLSQIIAESFDTGGPDAAKQKWYIRKIDKAFYGRFRWDSGKKNYVRKGALYTDKREAEKGAKIAGQGI